MFMFEYACGVFAMLSRMNTRWKKIVDYKRFLREGITNKKIQLFSSK